MLKQKFIFLKYVKNLFINLKLYWRNTKLNKFIGKTLDCKEKEVYDKIEELLSVLISRKL
ncbi:protein of unknown function [Clostridium beijerinckii]|nr:protein of unknown function [Clostridium beijerinckii]